MSPPPHSDSGASGVYWPEPVEVDTGPDGVPVSVESVPVDAIREEWLVEDRWWTPRPLSRRYFELALADGRCLVVFCEPAPSTSIAADGAGGPAPRWFTQRA